MEAFKNTRWMQNSFRKSVKRNGFQDCNISKLGQVIWYRVRMGEKEILCEDERHDNHSELPYKGFIGKELYLMILVYGSNAEINLFSKI
jgi:hypothetical protein